MERPKRPSHLKGKEIGMWYKSLQTKKNHNSNESEKKFGCSIVFPPELIVKLKNILQKDDDIKNKTKIQSDFEKYFHEILSSSFEELLQKLSTGNISFDECLPHSSKIATINESKQIEKVHNNYDERHSIKQFEHLKLPIFNHKKEILKKIEENKFVLISGDTGSGKTTQIPQFILDNYKNNRKCSVICTQPRRISAVTVAERVAIERNEYLGDSVGYLIRLEKKLPTSKTGTILYCTTGILLRQIETDPMLQNATHIILDEIHERTVESDLLMGLLRIITKYNQNLKVILMSATFSIADFSKYFNNCSTVHINGTLYPINVHYLEDILQDIMFFDFEKPKMKNIRNHEKYKKHRKSIRRDDFELNEFEGFIEPYARSIEDRYSKKVIEAIRNPNSELLNLDLIKALIVYISENKPPGAILVFLPGYDKICKLYERMLQLQEVRKKNYVLYNLHSMMPTVDQKDVFEKPPPGIRKIILSTNIAETSITIDDVVYVINSGRVKIKNYDIEKNYETLTDEWVTISHSKQRQGRAGRCQPGVCYNLYTRAREYTFDMYPLPEIQRARLEPVILQLKMMKIHNVLDFMKTLISCPNEKTLENGVELLKRINALNRDEKITPLGLHLARLPLDPQIGKMLLISAIFKCIDPITSIAATLSFKDPFHMVIGKEKEIRLIKYGFSENSNSDHIMFANVLNDYDRARHSHSERSYCFRNFLASSTLYQLHNMKKQLYDNLESAGFVNDKTTNEHSKNYHLLRSVIASGLYPNIACIKSNRKIKNRVAGSIKIITPEDGKRADLHPGSINFDSTSFKSKYLVYFNKQKTSNVFLYDTTMVYPISLIIFGDNFEYHHCNNENYQLYLSIAKNLHFHTDESTLNLIIEIRSRFDMLLKKMALDPNEFAVNACSDQKLIEALIILLSFNIEDSS